MTDQIAEKLRQKENSHKAQQAAETTRQAHLAARMEELGITSKSDPKWCVVKDDLIRESKQARNRVYRETFDALMAAPAPVAPTPQAPVTSTPQAPMTPAPITTAETTMAASPRHGLSDAQVAQLRAAPAPATPAPITPPPETPPMKKPTLAEQVARLSAGQIAQVQAAAEQDQLRASAASAERSVTRRGYRLRRPTPASDDATIAAMTPRDAYFAASAIRRAPRMRQQTRYTPEQIQAVNLKAAKYDPVAAAQAEAEQSEQRRRPTTESVKRFLTRNGHKLKPDSSAAA